MSLWYLHHKLSVHCTHYLAHKTSILYNLDQVFPYEEPVVKFRIVLSRLVDHMNYFAYPVTSCLLRLYINTFDGNLCFIHIALSIFTFEI